MTRQTRHEQTALDAARGFLATAFGPRRRETTLTILLAPVAILALVLAWFFAFKPDPEWGLVAVCLLCAAAVGGRIVRLYV